MRRSARACSLALALTLAAGVTAESRFAPAGLSRDPRATLEAHFRSWFGAAGERSYEGCVRGEATSWLAGRVPADTHAWRQVNPLAAIETFARDDGANLTLVHGGCESYAVTIRYVFPLRVDNVSTHHAAEALGELVRLEADSAFDLALAEAELRRRSDLEALIASAKELPVTGDGEDFLQTRIILEKAGALDEGRTGYLELRLVKGPL